MSFTGGGTTRGQLGAKLDSAWKHARLLMSYRVQYRYLFDNRYVRSSRVSNLRGSTRG